MRVRLIAFCLFNEGAGSKAWRPGIKVFGVIAGAVNPVGITGVPDVGCSSPQGSGNGSRSVSGDNSEAAVRTVVNS